MRFIETAKFAKLCVELALRTLILELETKKNLALFAVKLKSWKH